MSTWIGCAGPIDCSIREVKASRTRYVVVVKDSGWPSANLTA